MKHRFNDKSRRLQRWDYSSNGYYFLTIVTQNRVCNLGEIKNGDMILSNFGEIVKEQWLISFEMRNELILDEYVIMPNHIHTIVILNNTDTVVGMHGLIPVRMHGRAFLQDDDDHLSFQRKPKSISSFMAGFKSAVNSAIDNLIDKENLDIPKFNRNNHFFQSNYNDHIIRNKEELYRIKNYIISNPAKWHNDDFN